MGFMHATPEKCLQLETQKRVLAFRKELPTVALKHQTTCPNKAGPRKFTDKLLEVTRIGRCVKL